MLKVPRLTNPIIPNNVHKSTMNPYRMAPPPRWWPPRLSPTLVRLARPFRRRRRVLAQRLVEVRVRGAKIVADCIAAGQGVLITPNHSTHADPFTMVEAADQIGTAFYFMATWHVFDSEGRFGQWVLQRHGCFSIDREGTDLQAFKQAVKIVQHQPHPLVIFPERVKELRRRTLAALEAVAPEECADHKSRRKQLNVDLDDLFLVVQLFSYPGDYVAESPSLERMAETLDKFEEDVLGKYSATIRGRRRVTVTFGKAVEVEAGKDRKAATHLLTQTLEARVQELLDGQGVQ